MTTATTRSRARKARTVGQELMRRPADALSGDFIILSARLAETPPPVFWAEGELDARTTLAVQADADWDEHYRAVPGLGDDPWWYWNWYLDAKLADERAAVPVVTVTVVAPEDTALDAKVAALMAVYDAEDGPIDDPGPVPAPSPPGLAADSPVPLPSQGAGPGSSTSDEASDD